jgi:hypothetical protein
MPVEEFTAVVGIHPFEDEGYTRFDLCETLAKRVLAAVPDRSHLRPATEHIDIVQRPQKTSLHRTPAMGHRVAFQPARLLNVPGLGANRCQRFERPIGTERAGATPRVRRTKGSQHSINLSGADA